MFKSIEELRHKRLKYIKEFIQECSIEEKIDAYYVSLHILNKSELVFYKSNGKQVERTDFVINEMWQRMLSDWVYFRLANEIWFNNHIGFKIDFFYFPCDKPIQTKYRPDIRYLISDIESLDGVIKSDNPSEEMDGMNLLDEFGIKFKKQLKFKDIDIDELSEELLNILKNRSEETLSEFFEAIIKKTPDNIYAVEEPEGYVLRHNKKNKYAITKTDVTERKEMASSEKTQYEYLLLDFIKFFNQADNLESCLENSYIKTVCNLFNSYINDWEKKTDNLKDEINPESLQNPYVGYRFDICYQNIPNGTTIFLCRESELYKNIFKILLVNLKKHKKVDGKYMLMTPKSVERWNEIVDIISHTTNHDF